MDAFAASSLTPPPPSKMSEDAAMCRYGQASKQRGEACDRAGITKKGIEDGVVDRGTFQKCKENWEMKSGKWESTWVCGTT
ncbi:hypothetical protein TL16_g07481 [Triparma laevis f. inornata]|uniref:Uncharacterized protein n=2 Tax=Triparma laevis TaxID=1534972 RepID=A0A9W7C0R1_9STRA|nr:hypothetical protein TL16_g07481 [Triparma laevis f. inornata]GMI00485.1 hypothetical protein TrLO_g11387 [Triparma laevis f. longispina]